MGDRQKILICDTPYMDSQLTGSLRRFRPRPGDTIRFLLEDAKRDSSHVTFYLLVNNDYALPGDLALSFKEVYRKDSTLSGTLKLLYKLKRLKFDKVILVYNSVNRLHNIFFEFTSFFVFPKSRLLCEPAFVNVLKKHSLNFGSQEHDGIDSYDQTLNDFREEAAYLSPRVTIRQLTPGDISILYVARNLNKKRVFMQFIARLWYFAIMSLGSFFLFVKNIFFMPRIRLPKIYGTFIDKYYYLPSRTFAKIAECNLFNRLEVVSPSIEIGIENGRISQLIFKRCGSFDCGLEYYYPAMPKKGECTAFRHLISGSVYDLPFKDGSFNSVFLVHTMDHFTDIDKAVSELSRVTRKGGRVVFSTYSDHYYELSPAAFLLKRLGLNSLVKKRRLIHSRSYKVYNFFNASEWEKKFTAYNMKTEQSVYFICASVALWHTYLESLGYFIGHLFPIPQEGKENPVFRSITKLLLYPYFLEEYRTKDKRCGNGIFCVMSKRGD